MPKPGFALGVLVTIFWLYLDISIQAQPGAAKPGAARISGRVTLKGEPARGVTVLLQGERANAIGSPRARTDEEGRFLFTAVVAGNYSIYALAPGYVSPEDRYYGKRARTIKVAEGENVENLDLEVKRGGVIAGRIIDSHGRPVIEETVTLYKLEQDGSPQLYLFNDLYSNTNMYRTDDQGAYRIFGLLEGRYLVCFGQEQKPGSVSIAWSDMFYPRVYYPNVTGEAEAKVIEVTEGSEATNIDITVPDPKKSHNVYGRVVNVDTGRPFPGMEFVVRGLTQDGKLTGGVAMAGELSEPNGEFHLRVAAPGRYLLMVQPDTSGDGGVIGEPVSFDVGEGAVTGVEVKVRQAGSISGVVVIEGTTDPKILSKLSQVSLSSAYRSIKSTFKNMPIFSGIANAKVNADGGFRISGLQPGNVFIDLKPAPEIRGLTIARIMPGDGGFNVDAGQQITGVRVVLAYSALAIRGEVKVVGGALTAGLRLFVSARRVDQVARFLPKAEVDARGQFLIESAPPGEYEIGIFPEYNLYGEQLDPQTRRLISSIKERIAVADPGAPPVVLVIDLSRKEGN
jgi:carboxypeptidase family protein